MNKFTLMVLLLLFCISITLNGARADTVLRVSVPPVPGNSQTWESLSTQTIDSTLIGIPGLNYPANYTTTLADSLFSDLNNLKLALQNGITSALIAEPEIKQVFSLSVGINPITANFTQAGPSVALDLSKFAINMDVELKTQGGFIGSIFCTSPRVQIYIPQLSVSGSYNVISGQVGGFDVAYPSLNVNTSCGGILGFLGDLGVSWFINEQGKAENAIENAVAGLNTIASKNTVFSVVDFAESLLDSNLLSQSDSVYAMNAIQSVLLSANQDYGVAVDVEVLDGSSTNTISLTARAEAPILGQHTGTGSVKQLPITYPAGSSTVSLYLSDHGGPLTYVTTTQAPFVNVPVNQASNFYYVAIAHSDIVPGLRSYLSNASFFLGGCSNGCGGPR